MPVAAAMSLAKEILHGFIRFSHFRTTAFDLIIVTVKVDGQTTLQDLQFQAESFLCMCQRRLPLLTAKNFVIQDKLVDMAKKMVSDVHLSANNILVPDAHSRLRPL
jgi:hypothetical protein